MTRISEMATSSSMYTTRRLRLLGQAAKEPELMRWSQSVQPIRKQLAVVTKKAPVSPVVAAAKQAVAKADAPQAPADSIRVVCNKCQAAMRVPLTALKGKTSLNVRCPQCQNVMTLRAKPAATPQAAAGGTKLVTNSGAPSTKTVAPLPASAG